MSEVTTIQTMIDIWRRETQAKLMQTLAMVDAHAKRYGETDKGTKPYRQLRTLRKTVKDLEDTIFILDDLDNSLPKAEVAQSDEPQTWSQYLAWLDQDDNRETVGKEVAIFRIAVEKATQKLSAYHEFCDGTVDRPILSADTIGEDD